MSRLASNTNSRPQQPIWLRRKHPMSRLPSNRDTRPQRPMWLRKNASNDQAAIQQERKATSTNAIQKKYVRRPGFHPTGTQGHNDQVIKKKCVQSAGTHPTIRAKTQPVTHAPGAHQSAQPAQTSQSNPTRERMQGLVDPLKMPLEPLSLRMTCCLKG